MKIEDKSQFKVTLTFEGEVGRTELNLIHTCLEEKLESPLDEDGSILDLYDLLLFIIGDALEVD